MTSPQTQQITPAGLDRVRAAARAARHDLHLPGLAVGVVAGDDLVLAEGFGFSDVESHRPQAPALRQRIGSITKTMVGLCAMALVDEGRLSLDDRVVEKLPDMTFNGNAGSMTLRHILTHTSGIGEAPLPEQVRDLEPTLWSDSPDIPGVPEAYPDGITVEVAPGTKWAYANHAFVLLGEIVAREEGAPIEEVLRRRVFEPLGMGDTDCLDQPHPTLTTGYHRPPTQEAIDLAKATGSRVPETGGEPVDGHNVRGRYQYVRGRAAGGVQSNIGDMARYASALLRQGKGIVRPETFDTMLAPQWCPDERLMSIGLAFFREPRFGRRTFGHGGGVGGGWNTYLTVLPDDGLALLTHLNLTFGDFAEVHGRLLAALLDAEQPPPPELAVAPAVLANAPGVYEATTPGPLTNLRIITSTGRIQISARDGGLVLHARRGAWKEGVRMRPADPNDSGLFLLESGTVEPQHVALTLGASGEVTGLRFNRLVEMVPASGVGLWA